MHVPSEQQNLETERLIFYEHPTWSIITFTDLSKPPVTSPVVQQVSGVITAVAQVTGVVWVQSLAQELLHAKNLAKKKEKKKKKTKTWVSDVVHQKQIWLLSTRTQVQSLVSLSGLKIWHCHELWQMWLGSGVAVAVV